MEFERSILPIANCFLQVDFPEEALYSAAFIKSTGKEGCQCSESI